MSYLFSGVYIICEQSDYVMLIKLRLINFDKNITEKICSLSHGNPPSLKEETESAQQMHLRLLSACSQLPSMETGNIMVKYGTPSKQQFESTWEKWSENLIAEGILHVALFCRNGTLETF